MSAVTFPLRDFYDSATEYVGIKAGLLIERDTFRKILLEKFDDNYLISDKLDKAVRIRIEDIEEMFCYVRQRVGNLPSESPTLKDYDVMRTYVQQTGDYQTLGASTSLVYQCLRDNINYSINEIAARIKEERKLPEAIALAVANISVMKGATRAALFPRRTNGTKKANYLTYTIARSSRRMNTAFLSKIFWIILQ